MRKIVVAGVAVAAAMSMSACGADSKYTESWKDAPRGENNMDTADTITFPDGFSNVATKCDHGNRVYVLYKGDNAYGAIAVAPNDPTCGGGRP